MDTRRRVARSGSFTRRPLEKQISTPAQRSRRRKPAIPPHRVTFLTGLNRDFPKWRQQGLYTCLITDPRYAVIPGDCDLALRHALDRAFRRLEVQALGHQSFDKRGQLNVPGSFPTKRCRRRPRLGGWARFRQPASLAGVLLSTGGRRRPAISRYGKLDLLLGSCAIVVNNMCGRGSRTGDAATVHPPKSGP
jgi:hypothetical protein